MTGLVLGAYTAAPPALAADTVAEESWYSLLREHPIVDGLELAWEDGLHPRGVEHLAALLSPDWRSVVTMMSGTSARLLTDDAYGLASDRPESRALAVEDVRRAHGEILHLRATLGMQAVLAIELQSSPGAAQAAASAESFSTSLGEILAWDWEDVLVVVEHCDAASGVVPQKGFLGLEEEIAALETARVGSATRTAHTINWARSAIETHDDDTPARHLDRLRAIGRTGGLMFSGVAPQATVFGGAWADAHLPISDVEPASLLTPERVRDAVARAGETLYLGAKVSAPKTDGLALSDRLAPGLATLESIAEVTGR